MAKPVLYTFPQSVWAVAPQLALAELDVDADLEIVNPLEGANFDPQFLKLSPHGALPTLAHGGKSFSNAAVIDYLVSISSKKVAPATSITTVVYEDKIDANFASVASRNDEEFAKVKGSSAPIFISTRLAYLKKHAATPEAEPHKDFYDKEIAKISRLDALLTGDAPDEAKQGFYAASTALWDSIKVFAVETLPAAISSGPFIGGATPGVDDYHVGAWIARIAFLLGAQKSDEGVAALEKGFGPIPEKVKVYWSTWIARDSWVKAYPDRALH
ncbi:hypothetical protein EDB85DRAFT_2144492 [Lactarius pseudohatsudake]|nr:hypothetical protein EDB85DRAFT_2144492 [Lactarius pseudohatsudake]